MQLSRVLEQHIAVFGESGSGKTVMLSSFYGATQEPKFLQSSMFDVVADDTEQGHRLHRNYVGMRDSARRPEATRLSTSYAFSVKLRHGKGNANGSKQFDALRLVWHDYPGEWFEQGASGPEEASGGSTRSGLCWARMSLSCLWTASASSTTQEKRSGI